MTSVRAREIDQLAIEPVEADEIDRTLEMMWRLRSREGRLVSFIVLMTWTWSRFEGSWIVFAGGYKADILDIDGNDRRSKSRVWLRSHDLDPMASRNRSLPFGSNLAALPSRS
jgi:hypothetical protein